ncbi:hypothetical protein [Streptomyces cinnamoneus]|uniref:Uncharacterized protein n=1 Tax=Streptomyces cinnamoneus TaxID=53446 RepID=A0A918U206_STRCJ|nr:hypothetical protein GCM10010507_61210 [Streptomyces cinnamoneus]
MTTPEGPVPGPPPEAAGAPARRLRGAKEAPAPTLAFVESPVQLLNVLEWAYCTARRDAPASAPRAEAPPLCDGVPRQPERRDITPLAGDLLVVVLAPRDPMTRGQLRRMAELARDQGHRLRWEEARGGPGAPLHTVGSLAGPLRRARRVVIGDPFSRYVQLLLTITRARELVVVDDGTATMEFVSQLARGERLVRWHRQTDRARPGARDLVFAPVSASVRRKFTPNERRAVEVFTSMPVEPPPGVTVTANDFAWTRATYGPPRLTRGTDLVGTSLVETGVVDPERYLDAVAALALAHGATRYFAHRREGADKLHRIAARLGLQVVRPELPLELVARRGPTGRTVLSFPSTVVHTLPLALAGTGVSVAVCDIDPSWLTEHASPRAEGFLAGVTGTAREVRRLPHVPVPAGRVAEGTP